MDRRVWYVVLAVIAVLILAYILGWFGTAETPVTAPTPAPAVTAPVTPPATTTTPPATNQ